MQASTKSLGIDNVEIPIELRSVSTVFAFAWIGTGTLFSLEASYAKVFLNATEPMIGGLYALATVGSFLTPIIINRLKKDGSVHYLVVTSLLEMFFVSMYALSESMTAAVIAILAYGLFLTFRHITLATWVHLNVHPSKYGSSFAYQQGQANLAMLAGMGLSGPLSEIFGIRSVILCATLISTLGIFLGSRKSLKLFLLEKVRWPWDVGSSR